MRHKPGYEAYKYIRQLKPLTRLLCQFYRQKFVASRRKAVTRYMYFTS